MDEKYDMADALADSEADAISDDVSDESVQPRNKRAWLTVWLPLAVAAVVLFGFYFVGLYS
ncbi:hypothetical protein [Brytella acorum]|uniref:Uncharacterized protein n=1 Tax=Brytella acorum TaxID=2959299 RepID=A0AA35Y3F9_9PROT|nr:hypothetical protein [Brytella acorum]MDF3623896.1 hypothetical protein [Brytella acorum]CAI9120812.1 hypothetical protein LMG32879_001651 [Brytella acorum]